jgi:dTMP kinase
MSEKSLFIVIEGLDGSGKTSVSRHLTKHLDVNNQGNVKLTFEPHDPSCSGLFIRQVLMKKITTFSPNILPLAFATNRLDHCEREINPWLDSQNGAIVICDRYYLSSLVYQSSEDFPFSSVFHLNKQARKPDVIFYLSVPDKVCYERMNIRNEARELFEVNLSETRQKFGQAISYLREHNNDNIIEIDASGSIQEVADLMLTEIYKINKNLIPKSPLLIGDEVAKSSQTSLISKNPYTLEIASNELDIVEVYGGQLVKEKSKIIDWIESKIDVFDFNKLAGLFLDYLKVQGIIIGEKLAWTELDAYELEYIMPGNIQLRGVGLIIQEQQRYDVPLKKAPDIPKMSDFMFVFSPGPSELVMSYYERDKIVYNTETKQEGLFPSTQLITQKDLATGIYNTAIKIAEKRTPEKIEIA